MSNGSLMTVENAFENCEDLDIQMMVLLGGRKQGWFHRGRAIVMLQLRHMTAGTASRFQLTPLSQRKGMALPKKDVLVALPSEETSGLKQESGGNRDHLTISQQNQHD